MNFKQDEDISLALTALDEYSLDELRSMAEENTDVKNVLETIEFSIGKIDYPKNEPSNTYLEPQAHDYSLVESDTLFEFLKSFESDWEKDNFLVDCIKFWLDEQKYDKRKIYQILVEYVNERGLKNISYNLLDVLFPLAYEFDNIKAFEYVCLAQAKSFGWSSYFTDKKKLVRGAGL